MCSFDRKGDYENRPTSILRRKRFEIDCKKAISVIESKKKIILLKRYIDKNCSSSNFETDVILEQDFMVIS